VKIGFLQLRPQFGRVKDNVKSAKSLLSGLEDATVVLPELFNTGYLFRNMDEVKELSESASRGYTVGEMKKIAKKQRLNLVFGMAERKDRKYYNSSVFISAAGKVQTYQKVHLFDREKLFFQPGTRTFKAYPIEGAKIGMMVCFDWIYPEVTRILALQGAQIICHPSNLVLPYCQDAMRTRSIENRLFTITAHRCGGSRRGFGWFGFGGRGEFGFGGRLDVGGLRVRQYFRQRGHFVAERREIALGHHRVDIRRRVGLESPREDLFPVDQFRGHLRDTVVPTQPPVRETGQEILVRAQHLVPGRVAHQRKRAGHHVGRNFGARDEFGRRPCRRITTENLAERGDVTLYLPDE
jgi:predicted amidohydrolase